MIGVFVQPGLALTSLFPLAVEQLLWLAQPKYLGRRLGCLRSSISRLLGLRRRYLHVHFVLPEGM